MKKINSKANIKTLIAVVTICWQATAFTQTPVSGKIGALIFSNVEQIGWRATPEAYAKAENIFKYENIQMAPSFAFANQYGSIVFGSVKNLRDGLTFSAEQLSSNVPTFPEPWGIKVSDVQNSSGKTDSGLDYAVLRATGPGDGLTFSKKGTYKTVGVWLDIPFQYKDGASTNSVLVSLFYRGFYAKNSADESFLKSILNSLSPGSGIEILSEKQYKSKFSQGGEIDLPRESKTKVSNAEMTVNDGTTKSASSYLNDIIKEINSAAKRTP